MMASANDFPMWSWTALEEIFFKMAVSLIFSSLKLAISVYSEEKWNVCFQQQFSI